MEEGKLREGRKECSGQACASVSPGQDQPARLLSGPRGGGVGRIPQTLTSIEVSEPTPCRVLLAQLL